MTMMMLLGALLQESAMWLWWCCHLSKCVLMFVAACSNGRYGVGCQGQCHCGKGIVCHPVHGSCQGGECADGYSGPPYCQTSE
jgi:hypothetical protein